MSGENQPEPVNCGFLTGLTGSVTHFGMKTPCISREEVHQEIRVKPVKPVKCEKSPLEDATS